MSFRVSKVIYSGTSIIEVSMNFDCRSLKTTEIYSWVDLFLPQYIVGSNQPCLKSRFLYSSVFEPNSLINLSDTPYSTETASVNTKSVRK